MYIVPHTTVCCKALLLINIIIILIEIKALHQAVAELEIATHWSPMRPKIECWRLDFQNWSPAGDTCFVR